MSIDCLDQGEQNGSIHQTGNDGDEGMEDLKDDPEERVWWRAAAIDVRGYAEAMTQMYPMAIAATFGKMNANVIKRTPTIETIFCRLRVPFGARRVINDLQ